MRTSTYFGLLAEFDTAEIPLELMSEKYFGLKPLQASRKAVHQDLPVPVYKAGERKSQWLVNAADLALHIDQQREAAKANWRKMNQS